jgi:hypothetical protein
MDEYGAHHSPKRGGSIEHFRSGRALERSEATKA